MNTLKMLFSAAGFVPRRSCGEWTPELLAMHVIGDGLTFFSYLLIPLLMLIGWRRHCEGRLSIAVLTDKLPRLLLLYVAFILLCGWTHCNQLIVFVWPAYRFFGLVTLMCGSVSLLTVLLLAYTLAQATVPCKMESENSEG